MKAVPTFLMSLIILSTALMPFTASAGAGLSFGGRVTVVIPCLSNVGPSIWTTIIPSPATKQPFYIWTALFTVRGIPPTPDVPPLPGQEILGIADIPFWCCLPGGIPAAPGTCAVAHPPWIIPGLVGQRMQIASQSLAPSTGAEVTAMATAATTAASLSTAAYVAIAAAAAALVAALVITKH